MANNSLAADVLAVQQKLHRLQQLQELAAQQQRDLEAQRELLDEEKQAEIAENLRLEAFLTSKLEFLDTVRDFSNYESQREELNRQMRVLNEQENYQHQQLENTVRQISGIIQNKLSKTWNRSGIELRGAVVLETSKVCNLNQVFVSRILYN